jgi:hypothetical protein
VFLGNIGCPVKDIGHLSLLRVKYMTINKELVLNLDTLVLKGGRGAIRKGIGILEFNYTRLARSL